MLRRAVRQLSSITLAASGKQPLPLSSTSAAPIVISAKSKHLYQRVSCSAGFHSTTQSRDRDSVRQKGIEVTPSASTDSQQISFQDETRKSFGGITFPTSETFSQSFDGVPFHQIPVIHIKATSNNTIISVTDGDGTVLAIQSAGTVGFRNAHKGTNVAAQAAAIALADDARRKDVKQARVCIKGIGPGRFPALKAIDMSGIKVVSITDTTPLPHNGNRPKKVRRL